MRRTSDYSPVSQSEDDSKQRPIARSTHFFKSSALAIVLGFACWLWLRREHGLLEEQSLRLPTDGSGQPTTPAVLTSPIDEDVASEHAAARLVDGIQ